MTQEERAPIVSAGVSIGSLSHPLRSSQKGQFPFELGACSPGKFHKNVSSEWHHPTSGTVILDKPFPPAYRAWWVGLEFHPVIYLGTSCRSYLLQGEVRSTRVWEILTCRPHRPLSNGLRDLASEALPHFPLRVPYDA